MNPTTTLTNNNPPATHECGLNPSPICREESETPQSQQPFEDGEHVRHEVGLAAAQHDQPVDVAHG